MLTIVRYAFRDSARSLFGGAAGGVIRGMATLMAGSASARLIGIVSIPLLTRIYSPLDYGILSVYVSIVSLTVPLLTLRYVTALPLPKDTGMGLNLLALSILLLVSGTAIAALILWLFGPALLELVSMDVLAPWSWLVVIGLFGTGGYEILNLWAMRRRAYRVAAGTQILQSMVGEGLKVLLGLLGLKPMGLLIGQAAAQSGGIGSFLIRFRADFSRAQRRRISLSRILLAARRYASFPLFRLPSQLLLVFSTQSPILFAAGNYNPQAAGQLGLALMGLALPINIIGTAMGNAYYGEMAFLTKAKPRQIFEITKSIQIRLILSGIPIATILIIFGRNIFSLAFGSDWTVAGEFASILAVPLMLQLTSAPLIQVLNVFDKQAVFLFINIVRSTVLVVIYLLCLHSGATEKSFVTIYSWSNTIFYTAVSAYILIFLSIEARRERGERGFGDA